MARSRELRVNLTADTKGLQRGTRDAEHMFARVSLASHSFGGGLIRVGAAASGAGVALAGGLVIGLQKAHAAYVESYKVGKQTEAVLKSTGMAAGVTAKQVSNLAAAISHKTGVDDEAVQSAENLLLTFTQVRNVVGKNNDIFTQATRITTDMSVALGTNLTSSAIQVGKALNDPIKGVTALQRVGVSFTQQQKDQIKTLVESGRTLDAQKLILRELNTEFGGSAAAAATPIDRLKVSIGNLQEEIGGKLDPVLQRGAGALDKFVSGITPKISKTIGDVSRIWTSKDVFGNDLDLGEKIKLSRASIRKNLGPAANEIKAELTRLDLGGKIQDGLEKAIPKIMDTMASAAPRAAGTFVKAFANAGVWGQLLTVGLVSARLGVFSKLGSLAAGRFATSFSSSALPKIAAEQGGIAAAGSKAGRIFGGAFKLGAGVGIASVIAEISGIENANPLLFLNPPAAGDPKNKEKLQQLIDSGAAQPDAAGLLGLSSLTKKPVIANPLNLPRLKNKPWSAPTGGQGKIIGTPNVGTHNLGNWQSDNAVDISVTQGTPILAVEGGTVTKVTVRPNGGGRFAGSQVTIHGVSGNSYFYAHMSSVSVKAGQKVRGGQPIGASGAANGVPHLHFATEKGDPRTLRVASGGLAVTRLSPQLQTIYAAAKKYGIDPAILYGLYGQESSFGKNVGPSSAGALGPFQIMPGTARGLGVDPMNFKEAADGAARYLSRYKNRGTAGMLAAYNAGPNGNPNNSETRAYVKGVLKYSKKFPTLAPGESPDISPTDIRDLIKTIVTNTIITPIARKLRKNLAPAISMISKSTAAAGRFDDRLSVLSATEGLVDEDIVSAGGRFARYNELRERSTATIGRGLNHQAQYNGLVKAIKHYASAIKSLKAKYRKASALERPTIKAQISKYQTRLRELTEEARQLGVQLQIDQAEIKDALSDVRGFMGTVQDAIDARTDSGISRDMALASLTDTPQDDYDVAVRAEGRARKRYDAALKTGDADKIADAARGLKEAGDTLKQAGDTLKDYAADQSESNLDAQLIMNQVDTPTDTTDDRATIVTKLGIAEGKYAEAKAAGDIEGIKKWGGLVLSLRGDLKNLDGSIQAATSAIDDLKNEVKRQNDFAVSVANITSREAVKAVADVISGQIYGYGYAGRAQTAGSGSVVRY